VPAPARRPPTGRDGGGGGTAVGVTDFRSHIAVVLRRAAVRADVPPLLAPAGYAVAGPAPVATVLPHDEAAVSAIVAAARQEGWVLVVRGGGSRDGWGGTVDRGPVVVLDTSGLRGVVAHVPGDLTARVRPGTSLASLNAFLGARGQFLACDPPAAATATVGGLVAADAWGPGRLLFGAPRDWTLGLRVVDGVGQIFQTGGHVVKNVSGLDIGKLVVGSFGTLGVITEIAVRLRPLPAAGASWAAAFGEDADAWAAARSISSGAFQAVGVAVLRGRDPATTVVVRLEGGRAQIAHQIGRLQGLGGGGCGLPPAEEAWAAAHDPAGPDGAALLVRCEVPDGELPELFRAAGDLPLLERRTAWVGLGTLWCAFGSAGATGAEDGLCLQTVRALRAAAEAAGGRAVVAAGPVAVRIGAAPMGDPGDLLPWFRAIKRRFDPDAVLAPGRFAGGP